MASSAAPASLAPETGKVGIVGSGFVGKSWAMIFASKGYQVSRSRWEWAPILLGDPVGYNRVFQLLLFLLKCFWWDLDRQVVLYDILESQIEAALDSIRVDLASFEKNGTLRGSLSADQQLALMRGTTSLEECVEVRMGLFPASGMHQRSIDVAPFTPTSFRGASTSKNACLRNWT